MDRWPPELTRAVSLTRADFFKWTPEQQLRYRTNPPGADLDAIVRSLLRTMATSERAAARLFEHWESRELPAGIRARLHRLLLSLTGIGEDLFTLDEGLPANRSIIDYPTLRAYDEEDYDRTEAARAEEDAGHVKQPYTGNLFAWARTLVSDQVTYLTLTMAARHVAGAGSAAGEDEVEKRVPHEYVPGPRHLKQVGQLYAVDMRVDAGGQEALLRALQDRLLTYGQERWREIEAEWDGSVLSGSFSEDISDELPRLYWVFTDRRALDQVRFGTFTADCRAMERPFHELNVAAELEAARWRRFVAEQHEELLREG